MWSLIFNWSVSELIRMKDWKWHYGTRIFEAEETKVSNALTFKTLACKLILFANTPPKQDPPENLNKIQTFY